MCRVSHRPAECYSAHMQPEQKIIAAWMERTRERLGWSYADWAKRAGIKAATTVTRAVKPDYESITTVRTLDLLAKAAGEPSVLDQLRESGANPASPPAPSVESIEALLGAVLPLMPRGRQTEQGLRVVSAALAHGLELLGNQPTTRDNEGALDVAARAAVSRFRDLTQQ